MSDQQKIPFEEKPEGWDPKKSRLLKEFPTYLDMALSNTKAISRAKNMKAYVDQKKKKHWRGKNYDGGSIYSKPGKEARQKKLDEFLAIHKKNNQ